MSSKQLQETHCIDFVVHSVTGLPDYHLFHSINPYLRIKTSDGQVLESKTLHKGGCNPHFREHFKLNLNYTSGKEDLTVEVIDHTKRKGHIVLASGSLNVLYRKDCIDSYAELQHAFGGDAAAMEFSFWSTRNTVSTTSGVGSSPSLSMSQLISSESLEEKSISPGARAFNRPSNGTTRLSLRDQQMLEVLLK